jgi:hypothetical protein
MNSKPLVLAALVATLTTFCTASFGQAAAPASAPSAQQRQNDVTAPGEPQVLDLVQEDNGARIEELRVRGQTKRITVKPKVGPKAGYEILQEGPGVSIADGPTTARGAAGQRVWPVLKF